MLAASNSASSSSSGSTHLGTMAVWGCVAPEVLLGTINIYGGTRVLSLGFRVNEAIMGIGYSDIMMRGVFRSSTVGVSPSRLYMILTGAHKRCIVLPRQPNFPGIHVSSCHCRSKQVLQESQGFERSAGCYIGIFWERRQVQNSAIRACCAFA